MLVALGVLLGALSGYTLRRLARRKPLGGWERKVLFPIGWMLMGLWFSVAAIALLATGWSLMG